MHTDKSRQNPWALTSNTVVIVMQTFCLQRRCISLTEKWLTSSVIPKLGNWCLGKCHIIKTVYFCTVLTIWHLPKHQLPNVGMTDEVSYFSVREMHLRCKQNVCISMTTVLEVRAQGFRRDLSVCIIRYWDSEMTEQFALGAMRGEN